MLSASASTAIRKLIADLLVNPHRHRWGTCHPHALRLDALPVHGDLGGYLFITPLGRVLHADDSWESPADDAPWPWPAFARAEAARLYPELLELLPLRPPNRPDCVDCAGRGNIGVMGDFIPTSPFPSDPMLCGSCQGLGWVPFEADLAAL